jgi:hypothetical protein
LIAFEVGRFDRQHILPSVCVPPAARLQIGSEREPTIGHDRAPYSIDWNTTASPDGQYSIVALAYDLAGNNASARVSVTVRNRRDDTPDHMWSSSSRSDDDRTFAKPCIPAAFVMTTSRHSPPQSMPVLGHDHFGIGRGALPSLDHPFPSDEVKVCLGTVK